MTRSRPARGAWIETLSAVSEPLKVSRRAPHGARGLKQPAFPKYVCGFESRPARGAWIETSSGIARECKNLGRAPHGARGLKLRVTAP